MRVNGFRIVLAIVVALVLVCGAFSGGVLVGWVLPAKAKTAALPAVVDPGSLPAASTPVPVEGATPTPALKTGAPADVQTLFAPFWQAWQLVHDEYVDQPVNDTALMQGAIRGMMDALGDKHSSYMDPNQYQQANMPLQGSYEGIGAWVDATGKYLKIVSPMPDSPAEKAGVKAGDIILAVDGKDMTGIDGSLVITHVLGPAGTKVVLTIQREGVAKPFDVEITRAKITLPSASGKMLDNNIAYVQIFTFGDNTMPELTAALKDLMAKNPKGLIIDLRNNGGGLLSSAIDVASQFIAKGPILYEVYGNGTRDTYDAKPGGLATEIPLVVLVNEGTASASEIVSGAIQDYGRGKLVGVTTYGKGSVQNWIELNGHAGAIRVTIARWITPKERQINDVGLKPDVEVKVTNEDIQANRDPQLQKAIDLLLGK